MNKIAVILSNTGSPASTKQFDVARYLSIFLGNYRVVTLPAVLRKLLVNTVIVPLRYKYATVRYKYLWRMHYQTFPLVKYGIELQRVMQQRFKNTADVYVGMCFGPPGLDDVLEQIRKKHYSQLIILPLFPHYASSSTGVVLEQVLTSVAKWKQIPNITSISQFYQNPLFIRAFAERIKKYQPSNYDQILFTYHSLPISHVLATCTRRDQVCHSCDLSNIESAEGSCYTAACYQTSKLLADALNLNVENYSTSFQSQLNNRWQAPFTDELIPKLVRTGVKRILIVAPSFVADCLETDVELGVEYRQLFLDQGGEQLDLVESLNITPLWLDAVEQLIQSAIE